MVPLISRPTRITDNSATLIDNMCLTNPSNFTAGIIISDVSDHFPIFVLVGVNNCCRQNPHVNNNVTYRTINDSSLDNLRGQLGDFDFGDLLHGSCVSEATKHFHDIIMTHYDRCCPLRTRTVSYKDLEKPWIDAQIKSLVRRRQSYFVLYRSGRVSRHTYTRFRNYVTGMIKNSKTRYFHNRFERSRANVRETWRVIDNVIKPCTGDHKRSIRELLVGGDRIVSDEEMSGAFNNFFSNIG